MISLTLDADPVATKVAVDQDTITVVLADGRTLIVPVSWYPRLEAASDLERNRVVLLGGGEAIEWPDLDEHVSVSGLIAGNRSGESQLSFDRWLKQRVR